MFAFDLETRKVKNCEYCEAYVAGVYHLYNFYESFNGDISSKSVS